MSQPPQNPNINPFNWIPPQNLANISITSTYGTTYNPIVVSSSYTTFGPYGQPNTNGPWSRGSMDPHYKQFSEWEFSQDEIVGLRSWTLENGLLYPMMMGRDKPWTAEINTANHYNWGWILLSREKGPNGETVDSMGGGWIATKVCDFEDKKENKPNRFFSNQKTFYKCTCGFYGFWDGSDDYRRAVDAATNMLEDSPTVTGVIRAFGKVVVGTRGFRASKARISALAVPEDITLDSSYDSIPQFKTVEAMLTEYPLTKIKEGKEDNGDS